MADTKEKEPTQAGQADPGATPQGQEPQAADVAPAEAPAAPKLKQKEKQKDKQKGKKPAEGKPAAPAELAGPPPDSCRKARSRPRASRRRRPSLQALRPSPRRRRGCTSTTSRRCAPSWRNSSA